MLFNNDLCIKISGSEIYKDHVSGNLIVIMSEITENLCKIIYLSFLNY